MRAVPAARRDLGVAVPLESLVSDRSLHDVLEAGLGLVEWRRPEPAVVGAALAAGPPPLLLDWAAFRG